MFDLLKNLEVWDKDNEVVSTCKRTTEMVYLEPKLDKGKQKEGWVNEGKSMVGRPWVEKLLQRNAYET